MNCEICGMNVTNQRSLWSEGNSSFTSLHCSPTWKIKIEHSAFPPQVCPLPAILGLICSIPFVAAAGKSYPHRRTENPPIGLAPHFQRAMASLTWCFIYTLATETEENKWLSDPEGMNSLHGPDQPPLGASWHVLQLDLPCVTLPKPSPVLGQSQPPLSLLWQPQAEVFWSARGSQISQKCLWSFSTCLLHFAPVLLIVHIMEQITQIRGLNWPLWQWRARTRLCLKCREVKAATVCVRWSHTEGWWW